MTAATNVESAGATPMMRLNLLPWRLRRRRLEARRFIAGLGTAVMVAVLVITLAAWRLSAAVADRQRANDELTTELAELESRIAASDQARQHRRALEDHAAALNGLREQRAITVRLLETFAGAAVPGARYTSLVRDGQQLLVRGVAQSSESVSRLMANLASVEELSAPNLRAIVEAAADGGRERAAQFELALRFAEDERSEVAP